MIKVTIAAACAALLMLTTGCNTVEGAGKDVKATGAAVEKAADKAKPN
jgi:predicted small secreted protein